MRLRSALLVAMALAAATPVAAQRGGGLRGGGGLGGGGGLSGGAQGGARSEFYQACRTDLAAYCSGVQPGGGRIAQCMRLNWDKFSPACQKTVTASMKARAGQGAAAAPSTTTASPPPASPAAATVPPS